MAATPAQVRQHLARLSACALWPKMHRPVVGDRAVAAHPAVREAK
jgi:hypothetical protein